MRHSQIFELRKYANDLSGLYGIRDTILNDGRAKGVRAIELRSDKGVECTVLADRCMDIPYLSYKGINLSLTSKTGICSPAFFCEDGGTLSYHRQANLGTLTTCGLLHSGGPEEYNGRKFGLHGAIGNTPGEHVNCFEEDIDDEVVLSITGEMREACQNEEYFVLRRKLSLFTEQNLIKIDDVVENRGFETWPIVMQYHVNFGYPLLEEGARLYFSSPVIEPIEDWAMENIDTYNVCPAPEVGNSRNTHYLHMGNEGSRAFAMIHNKKLGLAEVIHYSADTLPILIQWVRRQAGNYSVSLEPSIQSYLGMKTAKERGWDRYLAPGEKRAMSVWIEILDDPEKIEAYIKQSKAPTVVPHKR